MLKPEKGWSHPTSVSFNLPLVGLCGSSLQTPVLGEYHGVSLTGRALLKIVKTQPGLGAENYGKYSSVLGEKKKILGVGAWNHKIQAPWSLMLAYDPSLFEAVILVALW